MRTVNRKRVVVMRIDNNYEDLYLLTLIQGLLCLRHDLTVIKNRGMRRQNDRQSRVTLDVGSWIPTSIWGYCRSFMYFVRTVYTALWVAFNLRSADHNPTTVFSDAGAIAIPILRYFGRFRVISMEYYRELMSNSRPFNPDTAIVSRFWGPLQRMCTSSANLILVPCKSVRRLLNIYKENARVRVLYPPAEAEQTGFCHIPEVSGKYHLRRFPPNPFVHFALNSLFVFVAVGIFEPQSNFNILIEAFEMLVPQFDFMNQRRFQLEIIGICVSKAQLDYLSELLAQVANTSYNVASLIKLRTNISYDELRIAYRRACAVLNANVRDLYMPSIIEALFFARVVITVDSKFATEVLENETNGIIIQMPQQFVAEEFAFAMHNVIETQEPTYRFIARAALDKYYASYSYLKLVSRVNQFIRS